MSINSFLARFRLLFIVLAVGVILSIIYPRFLTASNLTNVLWSVCVIGIMCTGAIYTPITGGIDLSVGSVAAIASIIVNHLMNVLGVPMWLSLLITLVVGTALGLVNGVVVAKFRVTGFIVTMAAKTYLFGLAMLISNGAMIGIYGPKAFLFIGTGRLLGIPVPVYIMLVITLLSHFLLKNTVFGRQVIAVGANDVTAKLSGVDPDRTRMIAYSISGFTATLAGIILASLTQQAYAVAAQGYEFNVITALVVGGTSLLGGSGSVFGALLGAILVGFIDNGLNLMNVPSSYHPIVTGIVILGALILNTGVTLPKWLKLPARPAKVSRPEARA
jgi:ribose/xylose/arabinose/galactoside ABC-type transport system permease subunit